ncbi:MAG: sensor domain-containing diguanylate cyclase [Nocardioidaceae bacterium]|nr:sensor domain-containing diguanylate cyclase [Nocardioidaceae bacterium]MDQ3326406.1 sensor domain-containing diguanylate cyclase [Actinomycetota bacterium]
MLFAMESARGVDELARLGAGTALKVLTAASASVSRFDAAAGSVRTIVNVGALGPGEEEHPADERYRVSDFPDLLKVAEQQRPWSLNLHDEGGDPSELRLLASLGKAASLGCPILVGALVWGELYATRAHGSPAFTARDQAVARVIAQAIALGVGRLDSHEHLTELVYIDALTGLGNRRLADETLQELSRLQRPVAISLWDVDGLKTVNDRDGHLAGDRLLREIALLLSEAVSRLPGAVATRLGGDEFCLIVPGPVDAELPDALTDLVDRAGWLAAGAGVSCGTATVKALVDDADIRALMRRADAALYRAKRAGGRRQVRDLARPIAGPVSDISSPHHGDVTEG